MAKAFLKWAGGKRWFISRENDRLPAADEFNRYIEAFLGGGSVFFYLEPQEALLSDCNRELIETYTALRDHFEEVYQMLLQHQENDSRDYYYEVRQAIPNNQVERAARMIYMNKVCFNGIYRVNGRGLFNVPYGSGNDVRFNRETFENASNALQGIELVHQDFRETIQAAQENDFLFCDPPYAVRTENSFVGYNANTFNWESQQTLATEITNAANRNVKVMMTNVDHPDVRALYDDEIFEMESVSRICRIAGGLDGRRSYPELIVTANLE